MRTIIHLVFTTILAAVMGASSQGCTPAVQPDLGNLYTAEQAACVAGAKTVEESCICRKGVDVKWGVCAQDPKAGSCAKECR